MSGMPPRGGAAGLKKKVFDEPLVPLGKFGHRTNRYWLKERVATDRAGRKLDEREREIRFQKEIKSVMERGGMRQIRNLTTALKQR